MPGGLLQIASSGIQDIYLTKTPEITFFKKVYRRHTNFSSETIEINIEQFPNYGDEFFINIPKFGDLVYRSFFKVEIPLLNFDDSYIKNIEYQNIKNNIIKNLTNEMNTWKTEYDTLVQFSNIQIIFYQKILLLLRSQDVTYQNVNNETLTLRNSYNQNLKKTIFKIDEDIYDKIDIISYIINFDRTFGTSDDELNNIITYETFLKNINILYKNNIKQLEYYFSNYNYHKSKLDEINTGNIDYAWIKNLGHYYFTNYNIEIDGQLVENYTSDYLNIYNSHNIQEHMLKNYNEMIGNVKSINEFNSTKENYELIIPLIFWFNRNSSNALPLVAMKHSQATINVKLNDLNNIIYFNDFKKEYDNILKYEMPYKDHQLNNNHIKSLSYTNTNINESDISKVDYKPKERLYIYNFKNITKELLKLKFENLSSSDIDVLFTNYSSNGIMLSYDDWINFRINSINTNNDIIKKVCKNINLYQSPHFEDLNTLVGKIAKPKIKFYTEYIYLDEIERFKFAQNDVEYIINLPNQITTDIGNTEYFSTDIDILKPTKDAFWTLIPKVNKNGLSKYSYKNPSIINKCYYMDQKIIKELKFAVQDMNIIDFKIGENFYMFVNKYNKLNSSSDNSYYIPFSLYPEEAQPSGSVNFSIIKGKNIQINLYKEFIETYFNSKINKNLQDIELIFINRSYNLLKFEKGKGGLIFY
jgi:hypothetical protein